MNKDNEDEEEIKKSPLANLALITQLGLSVASPILLCLFIGSYLDKKFNKEGIFTVGFLLLGAAAGVMNLIKLAYPKKKEK